MPRGKKQEAEASEDLTLDNIQVDTQEEVVEPVQPVAQPQKEIIREVVREVAPESKLPSTGFLRDETITVRYIMRESADIKDPKHVGYGGLFVGSHIAIPAPVLDNRRMKNILTKEEKAGLEHLLGKDLSIYGPFWKQEFQKGGLFPILLSKEDTHLDLSDPMQYITWKVLKASPIVANSLDEVRNKATYRFVLISEGEEILREQAKVGSKVLAYEKYVEYKNNKAVLRYILRNLGKYTSRGQKLDFLQVETSKLIEKDPKMFVAITNDSLITEKVLLEECVEYGVVTKRDEKFYTLDNQPISDGDTPTLTVASSYLNSPLGQEMKFALQAKMKQARE